MKPGLLLLMICHGVCHLICFAEAFDLMQVYIINQRITKTDGILWLIAAFFFFIAVVLFITKKSYWIIVASLATMLSQGLIISYWQEAKSGTIANSIILIAILISFAKLQSKRRFIKQVRDLSKIEEEQEISAPIQ